MGRSEAIFLQTPASLETLLLECRKSESTSVGSRRIEAREPPFLRSR